MSSHKSTAKGRAAKAVVADPDSLIELFFTEAARALQTVAARSRHLGADGAR